VSAARAKVPVPRAKGPVPTVCPFCGVTGKKGAVIRGVSTDVAGDGYVVECDCGASGPIKRTEAAARSAWNRVMNEVARWRRAVG